MVFLQRISSSFLISLSHPRSFSFQNMGGDFLLNPIFLRFFTASLHLILLLIVFISWLYKKFVSNSNETQRHIVSHTSLLYYRPTLFSCLGFSFFNLVLCLLNLFHWYTNGWSDEKILTLCDLGLKTLAWLALYLFLQINFLNSIVLRLWWVLFFLVSCCCLVIDLFYYKKHKALSTLFWASDIVSSVMGLIFCYMGFLGKKDEKYTILQQPLLNGEESKGDETMTPYATASIFSLFTFSWMSPLVSLGYKKTLNLEDVPQLDSSDTVSGAFPILSNNIESYCGENSKITTIMLAKGLAFTTWKEIALSAVYALVYTLASYVGPFLIDTFYQYLNGKRNFKNEGYVLVSAFFVAKLFECLAQRHWYFTVQKAGCRARAALVAKLYNKGLTLSCQSKQGLSTGEIINFMSVDAGRIGEFGSYLHDPWMVILQVALALAILYRDVGLASLAGLIATILVMLANIPLGSLEEKFQNRLMKSKDERMKATSEILRNMRILKLQAWEIKFLSKILELRKIEIKWLKKYLYTSAVTTFVYWIAPTFVSVVTFGACMITGIPLESGKILSALATFKILQDPIYKLPDTISMVVQTKVSLDRIASFLSLDDLPQDVVEKLPDSSEIAVEIISGNFSWDAAYPNPMLKEINFRVSRGMRVAICGTVGSGKSSLLSCILGEMPKISGFIRVNGTKAYVAQSPWIPSGNIEENILFG